MRKAWCRRHKLTPAKARRACLKRRGPGHEHREIGGLARTLCSKSNFIWREKTWRAQRVINRAERGAAGKKKREKARGQVKAHKPHAASIRESARAEKARC